MTTPQAHAAALLGPVGSAARAVWCAGFASRPSEPLATVSRAIEALIAVRCFIGEDDTRADLPTAVACLEIMRDGAPAAESAGRRMAERTTAEERERLRAWCDDPANHMHAPDAATQLTQQTHNLVTLALLAEHEAQARELAELRAKAAAFDELELEAKALARCVDRDCALDGNVSLETRQASADLKRALAPKEGRDDGK